MPGLCWPCCSAEHALCCLFALAAHTNIALTPSTQQAVSVKTVSSNLGNYQDTANAATDVNGMSQLFSTTMLNVVAGVFNAPASCRRPGWPSLMTGAVMAWTATLSPQRHMHVTHSHAHVPLSVR